MGEELRHRFDSLTEVNDADYKPSFTFTGKLTINIDRPQLSPEAIETLEAAMKKVEAGKG